MIRSFGLMNLDVASRDKPARAVAAISTDGESVNEHPWLRKIIHIDYVFGCRFIDLGVSAELRMGPGDQKVLDIQNLDLRSVPVVGRTVCTDALGPKSGLRSKRPPARKRCVNELRIGDVLISFTIEKDGCLLI
jgi:hypothetical protein